MYNDFRCVYCGKRFNFSAGTCGGCLTGMVIYDGAESRAARESHEAEQKAQREAAAAAKKQAEKEVSAREKAARGRTPNPLVTPSWNTPLAIVAFIAAGIFLAGRDAEGSTIIIGAAITGILAGVFYRMVFALVGVALLGWILIALITDDKPKRTATLVQPSPAIVDDRSAPPVPAQPAPPPILHKAAQPAATSGSTTEASIGIVDGDRAFATPPGRCVDFFADERMSCLLRAGDVAYLAGGGTWAYDAGLYVYHYQPLRPADVSRVEVYTQDDALVAVMQSGRAYYLGPSIAKPLQQTLSAYGAKRVLILQLPHQPGIGLIESKADAVVRIEAPLRIYNSASAP